MIKIAVNGAAGRMGNRILALAEIEKEFEIAGAFDENKNFSKLSAAALQKKGSGTLIDFSSPAGAKAALEMALEAQWNLVVGTTGLDEKTTVLLREASKKIAVVVSSNMSVGVNVLLELAALLAHKLPKDFDIEITEAHHRHKKDAPSGTALMLAKAIAESKKWDLKKALKYRAEGKSDQERSGEEIGMQVIRAGEIIGNHTVLFSGPAETIEITHRAQSRDTFARGALLAAQFVSKKANGFYTMKEVLAK